MYTFIVAYVLTWLLALMGQGQSSLFGLGMGLFYGLIAALLLLDIRGLLSLQNAIPPWRNRLVFGLLCLFTLPIWVGIYLARTFRAYRRPPLVLAPVRRKAAPALATGVVVTLALALIFASASPSESAPVVVKPEMTSTAAIAQIAQETIATAAPTPTPIPTATPTPVPAPTPKPQPTATPMPAPQPMKAPAPRATQAPAPSHRSGIGGNPYGFDLNPPGALIYSPPSDICNYISCIANFWHGRGYVEECQDGMFSKSGGIRGSCSYHGGDKQPLYKH